MELEIYFEGYYKQAMPTKLKQPIILWINNSLEKLSEITRIRKPKQKIMQIPNSLKANCPEKKKKKPHEVKLHSVDTISWIKQIKHIFFAPKSLKSKKPMDKWDLNPLIFFQLMEKSQL